LFFNRQSPIFFLIVGGLFVFSFPACQESFRVE